MNQGKPVGMTEQEWNNIVQNNYAKFRNEEKEKKEKLLHQREQMKAELLMQVASKADKEHAVKETEK